MKKKIIIHLLIPMYIIPLIGIDFYVIDIVIRIRHHNNIIIMYLLNETNPSYPWIEIVSGNRIL